MTRLLPLLGLVAWVGATLVLAGTRWARRPTLAARLAPYGARRPGATTTVGTAGPARSLGEVATDAARRLGEAVADAVGLARGTERRLARAGVGQTVGELRTRQAVGAVAGLAVAGGVALLLDLPTPLALVVVAGASLTAFLLPEQQLEAAATRRQRRLVLELPVVAEQLGMLLSTGHSLTGAVGRLAERGSGVVADDLRHVVERTRQGLAEHEALREWAEQVDVAPVHRLVAVLGLHHHAADLGRLIAEEARAIRLESHRQLLELIERRTQQVWVPVTVAALVPGLLFLSVPFVAALRRFGAA